MKKNNEYKYPKKREGFRCRSSDVHLEVFQKVKKRIYLFGLQRMIDDDETEGRGRLRKSNYG